MSRHEPWLHPLTLTERLAAVPPGSPILRALRNRPELLAGLEAGNLELTSLQGEARREALAVALFASVLLGDETVQDHFTAELSALDGDLARLVLREADTAALPGPYGIWPPGPLSAEDLDGPAWRADPRTRATFGPRLAAALEQAHLVLLHPRDITDAAGQALQASGWQEAEILRLNRLIAWLGALSPVVAGLRAYTASRHPHQAAGSTGAGRLAAFAGG